MKYGDDLAREFCGMAFDAGYRDESRRQGIEHPPVCMTIEAGNCYMDGVTEAAIDASYEGEYWHQEDY